MTIVVVFDTVNMVLLKFSGLSTLSNMGAYHPIAMVLLILFYILGITAASKGTSLHFMNFLEIDFYNQ